MDVLQNQFQTVMDKIGLTELPGSLLDQASAGLRFAVGGEEKIYLGDHRKPNGAYIENALDRAMNLYTRLPFVPDILRIDEAAGLQIPGLPEPDQTTGASAYWSVEKNPVFLRKLLREIIRGEIDAAGMECLIANVYFASTRGVLLFHLYDDRQADVVAADRACLLPLSGDCASWILRSRLD